MTVALISGSPRPKSQSRRIADYIARRHEASFPAIPINLIDLCELALPIWTGDFGAHPIRDPNSKWLPISTILGKAEALIVVIPEHHGIVPPAFMNLLLHCQYELSHKPGLIVAISATDGGAYPTAELRAAATKNNRLCWIPEQIVIRNVKNTLINDTPDPADRTKARIDYGLKMLNQYRQALRLVRESQTIDHANFAFGL